MADDTKPGTALQSNSSIDFFNAQFQHQISAHDFSLNPFEQAAVPYLRGTVLDFGCGMGNLAVHAARAKHHVVALDASPAAIAHLRQIAQDEALTLEASQADLRHTRLDAAFDTVISIGLLMFFDRQSALAQLGHLQSLVRPGGVAVINVLIVGTTFMSMFSPDGYHLFETNELMPHFAGWRIHLHETQTFPAADHTVKVFATLIAERPQ